ncbi:alpha/beta fold hydrolase [Cesiribacter sp. SM1]|uniref:alpha/beta fold hydrolase n=1 Tax=Cesiribacter sp. SM1 TaxID=2861196 RepID=UPI001CD22B0D|nr:alpha/beta hydrolase [Cesiribacter sp. SM1]
MKKIALTFALLLSTVFVFAQSGSAIRIMKSGAGKPVLFLPGFTSPGTVWEETISNLEVERQSHVISYAGFNGIQPIDTPWYATIRKELLQYIEKENLTNLSIVGHSMGGNLAVDVAAAVPERVEKLVLVDAIPCMRELMMPGVAASQIKHSSPYNQQMLQMSADDLRKTAGMMAHNMTYRQDKIDLLVQWSLAADRETYVYGYTDLLKLDLREALKQVKAQTLILGATYPDAKLVMGNFEKQYANLPAKNIVLAPESKHFIMFDQPEWFFEKVNTFLAK